MNTLYTQANLFHAPFAGRVEYCVACFSLLAGLLLRLRRSRCAMN